MLDNVIMHRDMHNYKQKCWNQEYTV